MRLGYNTNGLQNHRLDDALRFLADHGYEAVALTPDVSHLDPFRATARDVDELAALLVRLSLRVSIETGARFLLDPRHKHEPTLMTRDAAGRARRVAFYRRAAAIGADLGATVLSFWSGVDRAPGPDSERVLHDGVRRTVDAVAAEGLVAALEPEPGMAVATVRQWHVLREALGSAAPALTLDVGHLYVEDEGDPVAVTAAAVPFVRQVHLEDMRRGQHEHLPPGTGDVDFGGLLTALAAGGYEGHACFELSRSSHCAPEQVANCRAVWLEHIGPLRR